MPEPTEEQVEQMAKWFHAVYQTEARRQKDIRHSDFYDQLPENIKDYDRALARYVLNLLLPAAEALRKVAEHEIKHEITTQREKRSFVYYSIVEDCGAKTVAQTALSRLREAGVIG